MAARGAAHRTRRRRAPPRRAAARRGGPRPSPSQPLMLEPPPATATARSPATAATGARSSGSGGAGSLARGRSKWGPVGRRRGRAVSLRSSHYRLWRTPRRLHRKQPPQDEPSLQELCAAGLAVLVLHPCVAGRRHSTTRPPPARGPVSAVPARAQESGDKVHSKRPLRFKEERQAAARDAACPPLSASLSLSLSSPIARTRARVELSPCGSLLPSRAARRSQSTRMPRGRSPLWRSPTGLGALDSVSCIEGRMMGSLAWATST